MLDVLYLLLPAIFLCGVVAGAVLTLGQRLWRREGAPGAAWVAPLAVAAGFVAGYGLANGVPVFPPKQAAQWFPILAIALAIIAAIRGEQRPGPRADWILALATAGAAIVFIGGFHQGRTPASALDAWPFAGLMAVAGAWCWRAFARLFDGESQAYSCALVAVAAGGSSVAFLLGHSVKLSQFAGMLCAASVAAMVLGVWSRASAFGAAAPMIAILLVGLVYGCLRTADLPLASAALLVLSYAAVLVPVASELANRSWKVRQSAGMAAVGLLALAAIGWTAFIHPPGP